jgi:hypothetical protein
MMKKRYEIWGANYFKEKEPVSEQKVILPKANKID